MARRALAAPAPAAAPAALVLASLATLAAAVLAGGPVLFAAAPVRRDAPASEPPAARPFDIRFDEQVLEQYLVYRERGDASTDELKRWVRLPGNIELLRQGRSEGGLTPVLLEEAARVTVHGHDFPGPAVLGLFEAWNPVDLRVLFTEVKKREPEMAAEAEAAVAPYIPAGASLPPLLVRFHLGGTWDGRTTDAVYINLGLYNKRGLENLPALDALLVHEIFHRAHGAIFPGVEDWSSRQSALYSVLLRMQQEGIARHIEYQWLRAREVPAALDDAHVQMYEDGLRRAPEHARLFADILAAIDSGNRERARVLAAQGFQSGGPLYALGHTMAREIEARSGRAAVAETVRTGPLAFLSAYQAAVPATERILPPTLPGWAADLATGYARDPLLASKTRRDGLRLLEQSRNKEAAAVLTKAVEMDPTDAISAYNLACAEAVTGRSGKAMKWLREAFDRGFADARHAAADDDLARLRDRKDFKELLETQRRAGKPSQETSPPAIRPDDLEIPGAVQDEPGGP
jgi:tetratricopeptide (TPR) repeat protein